MNLPNATDRFAARLLMVSFFLPAKWQEVSVMAASVYFIGRSLYTKQLIPKRDYGLALLISSIYILYLLSVPVTTHEYRAFLLILCQRKVSLILMPFVFVLMGPFFRKAIMGELWYFVYACFISCAAGNADYLYHYYFFHGGLHHLSHVDYRVIFERFTGIHPTYMGMFLCFSICIVLHSSAYNYTAGRRLKYALLYVLLIFMLTLLVKSALIALAIILIHYAYLHRDLVKQHKLLLTCMFAGVAAACFFIPFTGQRIMEVLAYMGVGRPGDATDNSVYVRKLILDTDTGLLKHNWLTGVGPGRVLQLLHERYFFYSVYHQYNFGYYDPHNEYFYEWLSFGVIGIAVLLAVLATHFRRAIMAKDRLYLYLLIILFITFFTETVLSRQEGVLFYGLFTSLFFFNANHYQTRDAAGV